MFAKAFRLFVSSTFQDFSEERLLLQKRVFPLLEAHCAKEGFGFRAVDMRWGVNDDAQLNQRTAEICLGEVIEARAYPAPNLLILIGDRYGWVPMPFAIARDEFEAVRQWLVAHSQSEAVVDLDRVYELDDNHLVPRGLAGAAVTLSGAYTLRSREDDLIELRAPEDWAPVETRLRNALQTAARHLHANGQLRDTELEKYTLSLTEQEIRKGLEQLSEGDGAAAANSIAWVRTTKTAEPPVRNLVDDVNQALPERNVLRAVLQADSDGCGDLFDRRITERLIAAIDAQIAAFNAREQAPDFSLQSERATHAAFAAERLRVFVGRESNLSAITTHIAGDARHPLVLTGVSGSGKTALMAKAAAETRGKVVQRFVGASASSANQRNLLISLIEDLVALGVAVLPEQWEGDEDLFVNQVRDLLAALDQPVAIFVDALDQLRAPYRPMWLPPRLYPGVKLIVSVLDDEAFVAERAIIQDLRRSLPTEAFLGIEQLSTQDGADILAGLKREAQRGLSPNQEAYTLERFEAAGASPLYLRIAFAIACRWRSSDDPRARGLAGDVTALIGQFIDELSSRHHHESLLVRRALGLIAAGREGLSESEAIAVLSGDAAVMAAVSSERFGATTDRLPDSVWVRLKRHLGALLVEKGEAGEPLMSFSHRQAAEVVRERIYEPEMLALHTSLAMHFESNEIISECQWSQRSLAELPYQLFNAKCRDRLDLLLTNARWVLEKASTPNGPGEFLQDLLQFYNRRDDLQRNIVGALMINVGSFAESPMQMIAQLHGRLLSTEDPSCAPLLSALHEIMLDGALYETRPALLPPGEKSPNLVYSYGDFAVMCAVEEFGLAGTFSDNTIRVFDFQTGGEIVRLSGHVKRVSCLAALPGGRLASGSHDGSIRIWDLISRREIHRFEAHGAAVNALCWLPENRLASGANEQAIRIWDLATGREIHRLEGHGAEVRTVSLLSDGSLSSGSSDKTIRIWDPKLGREIQRLDHEGGAVSAIVALPDESLASVSEDGVVRVWDLVSGKVMRCLAREVSPGTPLVAVQNGLLAGAVTTDRSIRTWNVRTGVEVGRLCLDCDAGALAVLPDGRLAAADWVGTVHWIGIKGAGGEQPSVQSSANSATPASPTLATASALPSPPPSSGTMMRGEIVEPLSQKRVPRAWTLLLTLAFVATAVAGAFLGAPTLRDLWQAVWAALVEG